jgi:hypothetical protein
MAEITDFRSFPRRARWSKGMHKYVITAILVVACRVTFIQADDPTEEFAAPPPAAHCWTYWYWHVPATKENITLDLEAMHAKGIEGVLTFPFGEYMKPEWIPLFEHTLQEAERLNMKIVLNNDTNWSCKVPWMTPELAEKRIVYSECVFEGNRPIAKMLPAPPTTAGFYREIAVLACRLSDQPEKDAKGDAEQWGFKTANVMKPSYATGGLDVFYRISPVVSGKEFLQPSAVVDISDKMKADGRLDWDAPAGRWLVLRFGYTILNTACPDFFRRDALDYHLSQSVEKLIPIAGKHIGKSWTHLHEDSYENEPQTWTPAFREEFCRRRGYDMTRWLPVLAGRLVENPMLSDRFLHDFRSTISDLYVENHFEHFAKRVSDLGLTYSTEGGYGWASAIADGLRIEAFADAPMGEFWHAQLHPVSGKRLDHQFQIHGLDPRDPTAHRAIPYGFGLNSVRLAASAAHIYGKPFCQAEAFTSYTEGGYDLCNPPFSLKATADRAFCDGLGRVAFHVYDLQTSDDSKPNQVWLGVGIQFNRNITWWNQAKDFTDYLSRCQLMLRRGKFVADFAYWTGDTMPYECPDRLAMRPALPRGCNADLVNTDVLMNRLTVRDGRLTLPDGLSYRYLVMPPTRDTIEPASLRKIKELIEAGATVALGPRPVSAAGLQNYPKCDEEVQKLAQEIWGTTESPSRGERFLGKGRVVWGRDLAEVLKTDGIPQDVTIDDKAVQADFEWIHNRDGDRDIYFISNQSDRDHEVEIRLRTSGESWLWDPVWGTRDMLLGCDIQHDSTVVPLRFAARQSYFLVFESAWPALPKPPGSHNFNNIKPVSTLDGPWKVTFDPKWGGPANVVFDELDDWTKRPEEGIKFYSGTATYRKTFDLPKNLAAKQSSSPIYLDLGVVNDLAEVRLNGNRLGVVWTAPWRIDIRGAVKDQGNELEIDVVNQWPNRLIGDSILRAGKQFTKSNYKLKPQDSLLPSGLLGPVTLQVEE